MPSSTVRSATPHSPATRSFAGWPASTNLKPRSPRAQPDRASCRTKPARAAVLLPTLFALLTLLLHNPQAAGFSVFGTFAHLVMTNYAEAQRQRILQSLTVTLAGAAMIAWGTAVSTHLLLAVLSASIVAFATRAAAQSIGLLASIHTVVLLAFMLAVTAPAPLEHILPRLAGWLLSGVISLPILLITWISLNTQSPPDPQPHLNSTTHTNLVSLAGPTRAAVAMAIAVLIAGLFHLEHGFWLVLGILPVLRSADTVPRTFLQEQAGTLTGFALSALLVFLVGAHHTIYWMALPPAAFIAAYLASVGIFLAGQAAFTFFVVVLLNILAPIEYSAGLQRLTAIAFGGAISLLTGTLYSTQRTHVS